MKIRFIFDHVYSVQAKADAESDSSQKRRTPRCTLQMLPIPAAFAVAIAEAVLRCRKTEGHAVALTVSKTEYSNQQI